MQIQKIKFVIWHFFCKKTEKRILKTGAKNIVFILIAVLIATGSGVAQKGSKIKTVVIDAGHGGKDPGALGKHSREKDIALSVALKTGGYIEKNFPEIRVIYTRKTDKFIDLYKRGEIANEANADLFISIHCNANPSSKIYGAETYVLGIEDNRTKRNMNVAMMENAAILLEENAEEKYGDFDPKSPEALIGLTLLQNNNLDLSLNIAGKIQRQFSERVGRKDRSVFQAGFLVLWKTSMPSVLVELGYISNSAEERFLNSKDGQVYMASAIYRAFKEYKLEFEKENSGTSEAKNTAPLVKENNGVIFKVQFYTSPRKLKTTDQRFNKVDNVSVYEHNGMYKYTSGAFTTKNEATTHQKKLKSKGYGDAFVVAFHNNKRISLSEAEKITR